MIQSLISGLMTGASNDKNPAARRHPRRDVDRCVAVIYGRTFPVENWSLGGILLAADERLFSLGQDIDVTIKFKLRNTLLDIEHGGRIVRKASGLVALEFRPLTQIINRQMQQVIDDYVAGEFANSQA